jgi:DNA-binding PadR family transcriptional regulator
MTPARDPKAFLPLSLPIFRILLALSEQTLHGYAIMQAFAGKTGGRERILPGTLYSSLARMVEDGLVEELDPPGDETSGGPQRRYYRRTTLGKAVARAEAERMRVLVDVARAGKVLPEPPS